MRILSFFAVLLDCVGASTSCGACIIPASACDYKSTTGGGSTSTTTCTKCSGTDAYGFFCRGVSGSCSGSCSVMCAAAACERGDRRGCAYAIVHPASLCLLSIADRHRRVRQDVPHRLPTSAALIGRSFSLTSRRARMRWPRSALDVGTLVVYHSTKMPKALGPSTR